MIKVLFAAGECDPFIKTGGLADVLGSLPNQLKNYGVDARVIIPKYSDIPEYLKAQMKHITSFNVKVGWRDQYCGVEVLEHKSVTYYFIDNEYYFMRKGVYGFYDDGERFAYFCRAILDSLIRIDFKPDIIHLNDWHTGPVSVLLKEQYKQNPFYSGIKTFFTIHNLKYQGIFPKECLGELFSLPDYLFTPDKLEFYGNINFLKWGLVYSDIISTVSETYAEEVQNPYFGEQLDGVLRSRRNDLYGIINGIDYHVYDPNCDPYITFNYCRSGSKAVQNKEKLQEILNLPRKNDVPIICMITRLVPEKGLDLVSWVFEEIINLNIQFIILGTGSEKYEHFFTNEAAHHNNLSTNILFDNALAHKIYAGSDFILMPSLFEPCGLSQLIALSYGTIPIVRETGGLSDTVHPFNEYTNTGNGFTFKTINAHDMLFSLQRAVKLYQDKTKWNIVINNAMSCDYSWHKSAQKYTDLYKYLIDKPI